MGSVEVTVTKEAGGWRHKLVWGDGCCYVQKPACTTLFDVVSGNLIGSDSSVNHTFVKFKVCGAGF